MSCPTPEVDFYDGFAPQQRQTSGDFWYELPSGHACCKANSVGHETSGWYRVHIAGVRVMERTNNLVARIRFSLAVRDIFTESWRTLSFSELSPMHGRRIHIGAVTEDLRFAWHVHINESAVGDSTREFETRLALPAAARTLRVRLLFNYGVLADRVDLCIDESASHIDPCAAGAMPFSPTP